MIKNIAAVLLAGLFLIFGLTDRMQAQMFSVGSDGPRYNTPQTEFHAGLEPMVVTYEGDVASVPAGRAGAFEFEGPIIQLGYRSTGLELFLGTGGKITGIDDVSYFEIGGNIDFGLNLYRSRTFSVQLPLRISSRYTNIANNQSFQVATQNRFRFGNLTAGAGARILARPADDIRIKASAVPSYGFSFASGGFFGGSMGSVAASGRLYFDHLFGDVGLSLGYQYDLRNYDVDEDIYDYKMTGHSIEVGITF